MLFARLEGTRHASSFTLQRESMQRRKSISSRIGRESSHKHPLGHAPQLSIRTAFHEPEAARGAPLDIPKLLQKGAPIPPSLLAASPSNTAKMSPR